MKTTGKNNQQKKSVKKKYNPDTDIIPLLPSGLSARTNDKDEVVILDFFTHSLNNDTDINLGSYGLSRYFAEQLVSMLTKALEDIEKHVKKKEEN